jgi:glutaredoxin 3
MTGSEIVMYSTGWCGFCQRARALLNRRGLSFRDIDVEQDPASRAEMIARSGRQSVPQIFIGSRHVGGFEDLVALERAGELERPLNQEIP